MQIGLGLWLGTRQVGGFSPATLFAAGEQGGWYDPSDLSTMFQDSAGTTPVTATGQTVGLLLDKSQGLALGPELVTNGDFASATGWTLGTGWSIGGGTATFTATGANSALSTIAPAAVSGRTYEIRYTVVSNTLNGGAFRLGAFSGASYFSSLFQLQATPGTYVVRLVSVPSGAGNVLDFWVTSGATSGALTIDNISVKELAGNHLTQATAADRPAYGIEPFGGRRNLMTWTEQFDNAAWTKNASSVTANSSTAPDGTTTADKIIEDTTASTAHGVSQTTSLGSATFTYSVYAKKGERNWFRLGTSLADTNVWFNLETGTIGTSQALAVGAILDVGNGWYRCSIRVTASFTSVLVRLATADNIISYTGDGVSGIFLWGAQLETGSLATPYQRVTDEFNVTEAGMPSVSYVQYDGTDDWFISPTITPGIDKAQVFAGVRKLSDAATAIIAEFSAASGVNAGSFGLLNSVGGATYTYRNSGSLLTSIATTASTFAAPITNVLTGIGDIATDTAILRVNGVQAATSATDQGTGNFLAYPLYVGRRGGTTLPFNGRMYQMIVRFGANLDASTIAATEAFVETKTGAIPPLNATLNLDFLANAYEAGI